MTAIYNTKQIMTRAHEIARWRKFSVGKAKSYAEVFKEALRPAWYAAKQQALRIEQNRNGLPLLRLRLSPSGRSDHWPPRDRRHRDVTRE